MNWCQQACADAILFFSTQYMTHVEFYMNGFEKVYILVVFWKILHEIVWKISGKNSMVTTASTLA